MLSGFNAVNPVNFVYEHDTDLIFNQNVFATQQGLSLNLVNGLSSLRDETILNYSNVFLTDTIPVNDLVSIKEKEKVNLSFPTYLALSALPDTTVPQTYYVGISSSLVPGPSSKAILVPSLSSVSQTYFNFTDIQGLRCRISTIDQGYTKNLSVDLTQNICYFGTQNNNNTDLFEYSLDPLGYLKLFFRQGDNFYLIRPYEEGLSAVNVNASVTTSLTSDIFGTTYIASPKIDFKNNFIYYDKNLIDDFIVNDNRSVLNVPQNHIIYYNYESAINFISGAKVLVDFYKLKNTLSDDYYVNDKLPFNEKDVLQRRYTTILSKQNSEVYNGDIQLNYNYYTKEYLFIPDVATKFTLPETLYPYSSLNIDNSNLINLGSYGGLSPVFSDKVVKDLNPNLNIVNKNEANGTYLFSWLYTDSNALTSYWLDRYYFPKQTSINIAYSGTNNQIFNYTSALSSFLQSKFPNNPLYSSNKMMYYDVRSSLTFEPSSTYYYSRIGNKYVNKVVDTFSKLLSDFVVFDGKDIAQENSNSIDYNNNGYGAFKISTESNNAFTISFDVNTPNVDTIKSNLVVGNNFDEGISVYKGGVNNIFTPGYIINTLSGVDFFDINNVKVFSLDVGKYTKSSVKVLDIINYGFDHTVKVFYLNTDNNNPGFLDFSIYDRVFNVYEFSELNGLFNQAERISLMGKAYNSTNEIWYYTSPTQGLGKVHVFDYINNQYKGVIYYTGYFSAPTVNSIVNTNGTVGGIYTLSGFGGLILDGDIGVSKLYNAVYFKSLSANTSQVPVLCALGGSIFDINVLGDKLYVLTNGQVTSYDKYKRAYQSYYLNSNSVSGIKIDFINDNYKTKLLTYTADTSGNIIVDKFDIDTAVNESSYNTNILVTPGSFREFNAPKTGTYSGMTGIGVINNHFVSGGVENSYTYNTPIYQTLTSVNIDALLAGISNDCGNGAQINGELTLFNNDPIPTDVWFSLYRSDIGTLLATVSGDGVSNKLSISYDNVIEDTPYAFRAVRNYPETLGVALKMNISKGSFYNGSFRNAVIGSQYAGPTLPGFACALYATLANDLLPQNYFISSVDAYALSPTYDILPSTNYIPNINFNGYTANNPKTNFFGAASSPYLQLVANPEPTAVTAYTSGFSATIIEFYTNTQPTYGTELSGSPLQVPTNLPVINSINRFEEGDMVIRADLFSGTDTQSKQTEIEPFNIQNTSQITISVDLLNGFIRTYVDSKLVKDITFDSGTVFSSHFLQNNFGLGMPYINNRAASTLNLEYNDFAQNYSMSNFVVYKNALNCDEVKFNYLKDKLIDAINFDITQGTRNNTDTATSHNKFVIPGRKNNNVKIYIKNLGLNEQSQSLLSAQLLDKIKNILPLNTSNIELKYIDNE